MSEFYPTERERHVAAGRIVPRGSTLGTPWWVDELPYLPREGRPVFDRAFDHSRLRVPASRFAFHKLAGVRERHPIAVTA